MFLLTGHVLCRRKGSQMKRLATTVFLMVAIALTATSTIAEAANGGATVATSQVSFTLSSATCSNLPSGTTLTGSGTETSVTKTRTDTSGVTTIVNATHAAGSATDQANNVYVFNYSNEFRISNTVAQPGVFSGLMTDAFSVAGNGPARLHNGFVAELTADAGFTSVSWTVRHASGDPISFAAGPVVSHCDPL
jgi:hypothetical protein